MYPSIVIVVGDSNCWSGKARCTSFKQIDDKKGQKRNSIMGENLHEEGNKQLHHEV